jgi:hypothetical protein
VGSEDSVSRAGSSAEMKPALERARFEFAVELSRLIDPARNEDRWRDVLEENRTIRSARPVAQFSSVVLSAF